MTSNTDSDHINIIHSTSTIVIILNSTGTIQNRYNSYHSMKVQ
jgi:hypothetical protein